MRRYYTTTRSVMEKRHAQPYRALIREVDPISSADRMARYRHFYSRFR
jgi:hypothetical protein